MTKKILGLDLGVSSIGWSLIEVDDANTPKDLLAMGSRIVPLSTDDANEFSTGNAISKNQKRTEKRTIRKGYDRFQERCEKLKSTLGNLNMLPDEHLVRLPVLDLWTLRANAATPGCKLSLPEIGRVLYHINQKRGYRHAKSDETADTKQKAYVANVNKQYLKIMERNQTVGQYFAEQLKDNEQSNKKGLFYTYRIKDQVFPRKAYIAEFDQIMSVQQSFYPDVLTDTVVNKIRNEIIFFQRPLKSCKHLVSLCEFEKKEYKNKEGKTVFDGPKVAPKTSPLFQVCKIWESVNNLVVKNRNGDELPITKEQRENMFHFLNSNDKMTLSDMYSILGISKKDGWWGGKAIGRGLQGNTTKMALTKAFKGFPEYEQLLDFNIKSIGSGVMDEETGEVREIVSREFENEPLYKLWHTIYSINDKRELSLALKKKFNIGEPEIVDKLYAIDFVKPGFGNKSSKAMRRILPYLWHGYKYSDACLCAGFRHSESLTKEENNFRPLLKHLPQLKKNELRQPIVEKILNQMVNVVNAIIDEYGEFGEDDSIRVELARELKQSKDERGAIDKNVRKRENENRDIIARIEELGSGIRASRRNILKYRLWQESKCKCFYCGRHITAAEFLSGEGDIEHIIPKALLFDDSFSNKVCSCQVCNQQEKKNKTAFDFMKGKSVAQFEDYLTRIEEYYKEGIISKTKRERLLTPGNKIPTGFIDRDLRLTQYISRKSLEILKNVSRNVYATTGSVTDFLRHTWGYDEILHKLNFDRYKLGGLVESKTYEHKGQIHTEERIKDWSKRLDHRHHAIDALVIALTQQSYIQRLNNLNTERDAMFQEVDKQREEWKNDFSLLQEWAKERPHFSVNQVSKQVDQILVSFKSGKRVASTGRKVRYDKGEKQILQKGVLIPRGPLCEESVYGKIKTIEREKPLKYIFEHPDLILKPYIRTLVKQRLETHNYDVKKALASLKGNPIIIKNNPDVALQFATCFKEEYVIKYPLSKIGLKDINSIIDGNIRKIIAQRLQSCNGNNKLAFSTPLFADKEQKIPIKSVRCYTGLSAVVPVKQNKEGQPIGYVKPGSNHHIAIYRDSNGAFHEHLVTFWHAVERKKYGIPVVITKPVEVWDKLFGESGIPNSFFANLPDVNWTYEMSLQQNEMYILGMEDDAFNDAIAQKDYSTLNKYLFRVQKITTGDYYFRYHLETQLDDSSNAKTMRKFYRVQSIAALFNLYPHKVKISLLGEIVLQ